VAISCFFEEGATQGGSGEAAGEGGGEGGGGDARQGAQPLHADQLHLRDHGVSLLAHQRAQPLEGGGEGGGGEVAGEGGSEVAGEGGGEVEEQKMFALSHSQSV